MTPARIMHVDDEPEMREVVRQSLAVDPGLTVRSCASGPEALAAVLEWPPDLVLLDDMMPNMNGPATLAKLRLNRATAAIPVVFMTGKAQAHDINYFRTIGAVGVLPKSFEPDSLANAVRKFLRPRSSGIVALKGEFLERARAYAIDLASCMRAIREGGNRADEIIHMRQIARRLADDGAAFSCNLIVAGATALEEILVAEGTDVNIRQAIESLTMRISITADAAEDPRD